MNLENSLLGNHGQLLRLRSEKASIIASNIANSNTPGYKSKDFSIELSINSYKKGLSSQSNPVSSTHQKHMSTQSGANLAIDLKYRTPNQFSMDGNTVETDNEIRLMTENSIRYQYSLKYASDKIKMITDILKDI